jgi:hypothetical protein
MLGQRQLQQQRGASDQQLADLSNTEIMRSRREAEETLWKAWNATNDPAEKARIMKELKVLRSELLKFPGALEAVGSVRGRGLDQ